MIMSRLFTVLTIVFLSLMSQVLVAGVNPQVQLVQQSSFYFNPPAPLNGTYTTNGYSVDPAAMVDNYGNLWVAWESNSGGTYQIYYQMYNGIGWTSPQIISSAGFNSAPSVAELANGTIIFVWAAGTNGKDDHLYYRTYTNGVWRNIVQLTSGTSYADELPSSVVGRDSSFWLFFERDISTGPSTPPLRQIYYKTLVGNKWSADTPLTTDTGYNQQPAAMVLGNGNLWVAWVRQTVVGGSGTVYYRSYNGTTWSGDSALTGAGPIVSPDLVQDRNGTIWIYWSQNFHLNSTIIQNNIVYKSSTNVGQTWSTAQNLTTWGDPDNPINSLAPAAVQGIDTSLYVFYTTDVATPNVNGYHIYYSQSNAIYPVHHVGIVGLTVSPTKNYPYGDAPTNIATIRVTVKNYGDQSETVTVSAQTSNTTTYALPSQSATLLASVSRVFTFNWNLSGIHPGRYTVYISMPVVGGESLGNSLDSTLRVKSGVIIVYAGDVLLFGIVNINDEAVMGHAWQSRPGDPNWCPNCDILRHGVVDINDEAVAGANWLKSV